MKTIETTSTTATATATVHATDGTTVDKTKKASASAKKAAAKVKADKEKEKAAALKEKEKAAAKLEKHLTALSNKVLRLLEERSKNALKLGALLAEAHKACPSGKAFETWALDTCGLKRAMAYRWVKLHKVWGSDARFENVAARVLDMLSGSEANIIEEAATLAAEGKLDTEHALSLLERPSQRASKKAAAAAKKAAANAAKKAAADIQKAEGKTESAAKSEAEALEELSDADKRIARLTAELEAARQEIAALKKATAKPASLPMLPQFKASSMNLRLGLPSRASKQDVRAAYRALASVWNADTNADAFQAITSAKDALLK